jgi:hypothetical protein
MEVRLDDSGTSASRVRIPVTICTISPEGVGLAFDEPSDLKLYRGATVMMRFSTDRKKLEIPGRVAWYKADQPLGIGIQLRLELAPAAIRQEYADWIVVTLMKARSGIEPTPASGAPRSPMPRASGTLPPKPSR